MSSTLNPYLNFDGTAREAMGFYQGIFGGELNVSTFGEAGMEHAPGDADKVMHAQLTTPILTLMGADVPAGMEFRHGTTVSMSLSGTDDAELSGWFTALAEGGTVLVPLETAPWGDRFGMLKDKYGFDWLVNVVAQA